MSRPLAKGFTKVTKPDRQTQPPKAKPKTAEYESLLAKAALHARQQRATTPKTPRRATQPTQPPSKKRIKEKTADVAKTPKKRAHDDDEGPSPPPTTKRVRRDKPEDSDHSPASGKCARKEAQEARQRKLLQQHDDDDDDDDDRPPVEDDIARPSWADPLVELNARASQANRVENKYEDVYSGARIGMRFFGLAASPDCIIAYTVSMHGIATEDRPCSLQYGRHPDDKLELVHHALPVFFPNWNKVVPLLKKEPELITKLGSYFEKVGGKTRSDDLVRLKQKVIWAAGIEDPKGILVDKSNRGFHHEEIARLLCPKSKLERFNADPEAFCQGVIDGDEPLRPCDWWAGLYDLERAKPGQFRPGFLMSEFLVWCYLILFCSADSAAFETTSGKKKGQPSLSKKYKLRQVTLFSIIYTACLARHHLTTNKDWSEVDGAWNVSEFAQSIYDFAEKNRKWHDNLLAWRIYGDTKNEAMSKAEYEDTAFYHAMTYEGDGHDEPEDEFEDLPRPRKKPRAVGPAKRPGTGPAKKAPVVSHSRHVTSQPSSRHPSPCQPSMRPLSPPQQSSRHPSPRQPSPDDDLYYDSPSEEPLCRPFDDTTDEDIFRSDPLKLNDDTFDEHDDLQGVDATNVRNTKAQGAEHGEDGEDENMEDVKDENAQEVEDENAKGKDESAEDENESAKAGDCKMQQQGPIKQERKRAGHADIRMRSVPLGATDRDKSLPPGLTKDDLIASLLALSEEGDPDLLATLAQLKLKHAPKRSTRKKATAGRK